MQKLQENLCTCPEEYLALAGIMENYETHGEKACPVARRGLEMCKEDLTDCFACLLVQAKRENDQDYC